MRSVNRWLLSRSQVIVAAVLLVMSCGAVGVLYWITDAVTVPRHNVTIAADPLDLLRAVAPALYLYVLPVVLATFVLAALNLWLSAPVRKVPTTSG